MKKKLAKHCVKAFEKKYKKKPTHLFMAPGRINIIGEHVDYNDGFVLPAAINKYICFAVSPADSLNCEITALDLEDAFRFNISDTVQPGERHWANYIMGVIHGLKQYQLPEKGFQMVFASTIPMGAGLSSSAALETGVGFALNQLFSLGLSRQKLAEIGQQAEHSFVGVKCGIMDQFASVFGKKNQLIKLDCASLNYEYHPMDVSEYRWLLLDSRVKHTHLTSGYNDRRKEVEQALTMVKKAFPKVTSFRDCTQAMLRELKPVLGAILYRRSLFVVQEIQRVHKAVKSLDAKDYTRLGKLLQETHKGLSEQYEVSCPELDFLVESALKNKSVLGARMMGGGFGGCALLLIKAGHENKLAKKIAAQYKKAFGIELKDYPVRIAEGVGPYRLA